MISLRSLSVRLTSALFAGLVLTAVPAFADTVTFGSYAGSQPAGLANGTVTYNNTNTATAPLNTGLPTTGSVVAYPTTPSYPTTISGTQWVTYDPNTTTKGSNGGVTVYSTSYTGNLLGATGTISLVADDLVDAFLNGTKIGTTAPNVYNTLVSFIIPAGLYVNGLNTFTFNVTNANGQTVSGGPTGFDFKATAATPEPGSLVLLGTGLLSVAGAARRRFMA